MSELRGKNHGCLGSLLVDIRGRMSRAKRRRGGGNNEENKTERKMRESHKHRGK